MTETNWNVNWDILQIVVAVVTIILAPLVGKFVDSVYMKFQRRNEKEVDDSHADSRIGRIDDAKIELENIQSELEMVIARLKSKWDYMSPNERSRCKEQLKIAKRFLEEGRQESNLIKAMQASRIIYDTKKLITREINRTAKGYALGLSVSLLLVVAVIAGVTSKIDGILDWTIFDIIPIYTFFFSGFGAILAALYEYIGSKKVFPHPEKTFIIKPIFGMCVGVIPVLMVSTGLIVFGGSGNSANSPVELYAVVAFVSGFYSDRAVKIISNVSFKKPSSDEPPDPHSEEPDRLGFLDNEDEDM